jgi:PAS domain-containing protein
MLMGRSGEGMTVTAAGDGEFARLSGLIARQRRELDRMQSVAAARSVADLARGMLMERLGCSAAEAQEQLAHLSAESGTTVPELAAQIASQALLTGQGLLTSQGLLTGQGQLTSHGRLTSRGQPAGQGPASDAAEPAARRLGLAGAVIETSPEMAGVAAALLEEALAPTGAVAVALWLTEPDGGLALASEAGFGPREASRWRRIHPDMCSLAHRAAHEGLEFWWPAGPPEADRTPLMGRWRAGARVVLPLRGDRVTLGAMEICWPDSRTAFAAPMRRQITALAEVCAQALGTRLAYGDLADDRASWILGLLDGLLESAMFARGLRDAEGRLVDFLISHLSDGFRDPAGRSPADLAGRSLLEVYPAAALPGGLYDRAAAVLATGEPQHASGEVISMSVRHVAMAPVMEVRIVRLFDGVVIAWRRADEVERLAALLQHAQRLGHIGGWEENLLTGDVHWTDRTFALFGRQPGDPVPIADLHTRVPPDDIAGVERFRSTLLTEQKATAAIFRIIRPDDQSVRQMRVFAEPVTDQAGTLVAVRGAYQDVSADYHTQVAFAATRDQLADTRDQLADTAERAEEDRVLALRLQQAITPRSAQPVDVAGLEIAARYRPAGPGNLVSGDWYDTVPLPGGQVLLVVGDVAGHGIDAVTGMVALRNCLRGLAITGADPGALLGWLNNVACHLTDGIVGTAVCGLYDPVSRSLRWARAGHMPPVLVRDGVARELSLPQGVLLGVDPDASYEEVTTSLRPGDALLLFTDGLIERRDEAIDDSTASLLRIASRPVGSIAHYADYLLDHAPSDTGDDACLVAVRVR